MYLISLSYKGYIAIYKGWILQTALEFIFNKRTVYICKSNILKNIAKNFESGI